MQNLPDLSIRPLEPADWHLLAELFESDAECSDCWCMNHRLQSAPSGQAARLELQQRVEKGLVPGLLAHLDEQAIGWCGLDRRSELPGHDATFPLPPDHEGIWTIHCFFIHRDFRGRGVARALLQGAIQMAASLGAATLEAYPTRPPSNQIFEFSGPWKLYQQAGFTAEQDIDRFYTRVVKKFVLGGG